jgi:translation initiation factor 3 subunit F
MTTSTAATTKSPFRVESCPALLEEEPVVLVHPVAILHVLDHHSRRGDTDGRVIGTLLGQRRDNVVEITDSFAVPHAERGEEVAIGKDFNKKMLALNSRVNRKDVVVGWYASAPSDPEQPVIMDTSSLIHEFYAGESDDGDPVHLVVDTRLNVGDEGAALNIRAYKSVPVTVGGELLGNLFHELPVQMSSTEPETICLHDMIQGNENGGKDDETPALQASMEKLYGLLDQCLKYVDKVVAAGGTADAELGRQIADTLATVPRVRPETFDRLFHDSLQDLLMVTYLSNITRTQLTIAEKLNASLG